MVASLPVELFAKPGGKSRIGKQEPGKMARLLCCGRALDFDKPAVWTILEFVVSPLISSVHVKEVLTMHPPDGSLVSRHSPECKPLFRVFAEARISV